jgi:hypothetical protein
MRSVGTDLNEVVGWINHCPNAACLRSVRGAIDDRLSALGQPVVVPPPAPLGVEPAKPDVGPTPGLDAAVKAMPALDPKPLTPAEVTHLAASVTAGDVAAAVAKNAADEEVAAARQEAFDKGSNPGLVVEKADHHKPAEVAADKPAAAHTAVHHKPAAHHKDKPADKK